MNLDELKEIETRARYAQTVATELGYKDSPHATDVLRLAAEVRRLQKSLGEAVAANLCHVPIQRVMGEAQCRNCGGACEPLFHCARCMGA